MSNDYFQTSPFSLSDGEPTDNWQEEFWELIDSPEGKHSRRICVALGSNTSTQALDQIANVSTVRATDAERLFGCFPVAQCRYGTATFS
jgi:uncharacterized protein YegL